MSCTANLRKADGVTIIDLGGRFIIGDGTGVIAEAVREVLRTGERNILLNLEQVTYLDSAAGVGGLVAGYTTATKEGAKLKLLRPGKRVDYVLQVVGLYRVFETYDDEAAAIRSFQTAATAASHA